MASDVDKGAENVVKFESWLGQEVAHEELSAKKRPKREGGKTLELKEVWPLIDTGRSVRMQEGATNILTYSTGRTRAVADCQIVNRKVCDWMWWLSN